MGRKQTIAQVAYHDIYNTVYCFICLTSFPMCGKVLEK